MPPTKPEKRMLIVRRDESFRLEKQNQTKPKSGANNKVNENMFLNHSKVTVLSGKSK
jgi:hypothetical protein